MESIVVPYLAANVFKCEMRPVAMEEHFYHLNFICE